MPKLPERNQQIVQTHAALINQVVKACANPDGLAELEPVLRMAHDNGWTNLVAVIRTMLDGRRDESVLAGLDEEDRAICEAILRGIQDPNTLPDPNAKASGAAAAPALASIIQAAAKGDLGALEQIGTMAESMNRAGGDMARIAACIRPMVNGERDANRLAQGLGAQAEGLLLAILNELAKLEPH